MTARNSAIAGRFRSKTKVLTSPQFRTILNGISLGAYSGSGVSWTRAISGTDGVTGAVFPTTLNTMFGASTSMYIDLPAMDVSCANGAAVEARTTSVLQTSTDTTPNAQELVITQIVKDSSKVQQGHLAIYRYTGAAYPNGTQPSAINEMYIVARIKIPSNIETLLTSGNYYMGMEFKTGGYLGTWRGDYRARLYINKGGALAYWRGTLDNNANGQDGTCPGVTAEYVAAGNTYTTYKDDYVSSGGSGSVSTGWHTVEMYIKRPANRADITTGRTWMAVTSDATKVRQKVCDFSGGVQMGADALPISRVFIGMNYTDSVTVPQPSALGAFEIWDHLPAGVAAPT